MRPGKVLVLVLALLAFACAHKKEASRVLGPVHPRVNSEKKVGLALGGGSSRGFAQIGVLRVLERERIPVSFVAGTSAGSVIGALYCDAGSVADLEYHAATIEKEDVLDYNFLKLFAGPGLIKGDKLEAFLLRNLRHRFIEDLPVPLSIVATDLMTGEKFVFERGSIEIAVHASCAIPGIFQPVQIGSTVFVDGGLSDPVPVDVVREKGADIVIAVVIPDEFPEEMPSKSAEIVRHSLNMLFARMTEYVIKDADVVIRPKCESVRLGDFSKRNELIKAGEEAAIEAIPRIKALLEQ